MQGIASGTVWTACCWEGTLAHYQCAVIVFNTTSPPPGEFSLLHARTSYVAAVSTTA